MLEAGVELMYHAFLAAGEVSDGKIQSIRIATKAGLKELTAKVYVDSTGTVTWRTFPELP